MTAIRIEADYLFWRPGSLPAERGAVIALGDPGSAPVIRLGGSGTIVMPAPANAHDHGRALSPVAFGASDRPLEAWIPATALLPAVDPYLQGLVAFGRLAAAGVAATQVAYDPLRLDDLPGEAEKVARAAREVGIRVGLALPVLDRNLGGYVDKQRFTAELDVATREAFEIADSSLPPIADQVAAVEEAARLAEGGGVSVHFHAVGPTWCSPELMEMVAERSAATGRRVFMHLLETRRQRAWLDRTFDGDPIGKMDRAGLLSPRLGCAHGVHLREDEIALLAERGVTLSVNTSSNLRLNSGIAPVPAFLRHGLAMGIGLDSLGFGDTPDLFTEMRLMRLVHSDGSMRRPVDDPVPFEALQAGHRLAGDASEGKDWVVIDYEALAPERSDERADPIQLMLTRLSARHVTDLVVDGRVVLADRKLTGINLPEVERALASAARSAKATGSPAIASALSAAATRYFARGEARGSG